MCISVEQARLVYQDGTVIYESVFRSDEGSWAENLIVQMEGLEPSSLSAGHFKCPAFANFATSASNREAIQLLY